MTVAADQLREPAEERERLVGIEKLRNEIRGVMGLPECIPDSAIYDILNRWRRIVGVIDALKQELR